MTSRQYVGSSISIRGRLNSHRQDLRGGVHCNSLLQDEWDRHGEASFTFELIEAVSNIEALFEREAHWIRVLRPDLNIQSVPTKPRVASGWQIEDVEVETPPWDPHHAARRDPLAGWILGTRFRDAQDVECGLTWDDVEEQIDLDFQMFADANARGYWAAQSTAPVVTDAVPTFCAYAKGPMGPPKGGRPKDPGPKEVEHTL